MRIKIMLFIITIVISLQAATAYGMGVGVSPGNMTFKLAPGTSVEQTIYVINTGNETANYDVFVNESTYQNWFTFSPSSFTLKAGEQKEVKVTLKVPASAETNVKCKIKIPCTVPGKTVGAGIIIPVQIEISTLYALESFIENAGNSGLNEIKQICADTTKSLNNTIKSLVEKNPSALAGIEGYEEKLHVLPGFDAPLEFICLVISGLLMRRQILK